jgi:hypothetical protein
MKALICLCVLFLSSSAWSWSQSVHSASGEATYQALSKEQRRYFAKLAKALPSDVRLFRDMSGWVDTVRGEPIIELFERDVPRGLEAFASSHSARWHYQNAPYRLATASRPCSITDNGQLESAFLAVSSSLNETLTVRQEAMLIAFAMHLLEDAHQPLHTGTLVRSDCSVDRGGNLYCLHKYANRCAMNLHRLWDAAFALDRSSQFWRAIPSSNAPFRPANIEIAAVLAEGEMLLDEVYATPENRLPREAYLEWAKTQTQARLTKMVQRNVAFLKAHYHKKHMQN